MKNKSKLYKFKEEIMKLHNSRKSAREILDILELDITDGGLRSFINKQSFKGTKKNPK